MLVQHHQHRQLFLAWDVLHQVVAMNLGPNGRFWPRIEWEHLDGFRLRFSLKPIQWHNMNPNWWHNMIWPNTLIYGHQGPAGDFDTPFDTRHSGPAFWLDGLIHLEQWQNQLPVANVYPKMVFLWWFSQPIRKARPIGLKSAQQIGNRDTAWKIGRKIHKFLKTSMYHILLEISLIDVHRCSSTVW